MKKAILPVMISALLATSAQAANLYEADGTAVALSGEVDAVFKTSDAEGSADDENGLVSSWANVQLDISTKVSDSVNAMASFEVEATDAEEVKVDDAWLGFEGNFGTIKFGETGSSYAVLEKAELTNEGDDYDVDYSDGEDSGHAIRYQKTIGSLDLSANYAFESDAAADDTVSIDNDTNVISVEDGTVTNDSFAVSADYSVDEFTVGVAYIDGSDNTHSVGISASMELDALYLASTYTFNDVDSGSANDFSTAAVSASYAIEDIATVYGSYQINDGDNTDITNYYVGVSRDITANVYAFVEYIALEDDNADSSAMYAGVYYSF